MANIHIILQGKGGVGKSMIAAVMAQYMTNNGGNPICIDTDPVNITFGSYHQLHVLRLEIMEGDEINPRNFDRMMELIAPAKDDVIIDNGASSFVPLSHYLLVNQVPAMLAGMGHKLIIHTVITGGQALQDTLHGLVQLVSQFPHDCAFIVWLNPFWGSIEQDGKTFEEMKAYLSNKDRITGIIRIPTLKEELHGRDFAEMLQQRMTFEEAVESPMLSLMSRQRLKIVQKEINNQITGGLRI